MNKLLRLSLFGLPLLLIFAACTRRPEPVLPPEEMAQLLTDLSIADAYASEQSYGLLCSDSLMIEFRRSVLAQHGVNEATLDTSLRWYGSNLPELLKVYDRVDSLLVDSLRALDREAIELKASAAGDSLNVWPLTPSVVMQGSQFLTFELPLDSSWHRADVVEWKVAVHNGGDLPVRFVLAADYADRARTTEARTFNLNLRESNHAALTLQLNRDKAATRLYGYVQIPLRDPKRRVFLDSITMVRTRLIDGEYFQRRYRQSTITRHSPL